MKLERKRRAVSGGDISFLDLGDGPAVVLLHGFPTSSFLWRREAVLLSSRMRVIAPDLLGYGSSEKPVDADLTIAAQAGYVRELLDHLDVSEFAVVGHEAGGGIAQLLALGGGVPAMVLLDSICFDAWPWEGVRALHSMTEEERTRESAQRFVREFLHRGVSRSERLEEAVERSYLEPWQEDARSLVRAARALDGGGLTRREHALAQLELSAFIIWGEDDPFLPSALAERLGETLPGSTVALLPGCSHLVNEDAPQTVGPLIHEFLRYRYLGESHGHVGPREIPVYLERPPLDAHLSLPDEGQ